jgi:hypothetical protein
LGGGFELLSRLVTKKDWFYRCLDDVDDEVRDRAAMYLRVMKEQPLAEKLVQEGESSAPAGASEHLNKERAQVDPQMLCSPWPFWSQNWLSM